MAIDLEARTLARRQRALDLVKAIAAGDDAPDADITFAEQTLGQVDFGRQIQLEQLKSTLAPLLDELTQKQAELVGLTAADRQRDDAHRALLARHEQEVRASEENLRVEAQKSAGVFSQIGFINRRIHTLRSEIWPLEHHQ